MVVLFTGGSGSGKSSLAENRAAELGGSLLYIATMIPCGEESEKRILRHRKMRAGKGFETVECYGDLSEVTQYADTMLLECLPNLAANIMFGQKCKNAFDVIMKNITKLRCENLVIVTDEISSDGITYDDETEKYIKLLGKLNYKIAQKADEVYEAVCQIPVRIK